jgi:hypothetical protein
MTTELPDEFPVGADLSISLGYATLTVFRREVLTDAQLGHSVDANGKSLTGLEQADWRSSWIVIGYESLCGDPLFIDPDSHGFPVYTAAHGMGEWDPDLIASSLDNMFAILQEVKPLTVGPETPVSLEENPIPTVDVSKVLDSIESNNPGVELEFWRSWLCETDSL